MHEVNAFYFNCGMRKQEVVLLLSKVSQPQAAAAADFLSSLNRRPVIEHCTFSLVSLQIFIYRSDLQAFCFKNECSPPPTPPKRAN